MATPSNNQPKEQPATPEPAKPEPQPQAQTSGKLSDLAKYVMHNSPDFKDSPELKD